MEALKVIDSDGHVQEHDADVRPYMEEPYCKRRGSLLPSDEWDSSMYGALGLKVRDVADAVCATWIRKPSTPPCFFPPARFT
jgi:hypothetical protein